MSDAWDGIERRREERRVAQDSNNANIETLQVELIRVRRGLAEVADAMIPRPEVESRFDSVHRLNIVLLVGIVVAILSTGVSISAVRDLRHQAGTRAKANKEAQQLGLDAVNCLRYNLLEHRWVNEEYHKEQAVALHLPLPAHSALPERPTAEQINMACDRFNAVVGGPPTPTTKGK